MLRSLLVILCLTWAACAAAAIDLNALWARANALDLAASPAWRALLHYPPSGAASAVVSPWFFNAPNGRHDPRAELQATLKAFLRGRTVGARGAPARCVFPDRYAWLRARLSVDFPDPDCPDYRAWRERLDASSVALVFAAAYLNNPPSMFGHTLLRIDPRGAGRRPRLLAYAVNFSARTGDDEGVVYAYKGITGGYEGHFDGGPFYEKVKQYARIESRDIWSYDLALTPAEIDRLAAHLWALRKAGFRYTFFSRNCAYQLLTLLRAARPSLSLTDALPPWTIPADVLRVLAAEPGLVRDVDYRPAASTRLRAYAAQLDPVGRRRVRRLAKGRLDPARLRAASPERRARWLEAAFDLVRYRRVSGQLPPPAASRRESALLLARSHVPVQRRVFRPPPAPLPPHAGHASARLAVGPVWEAGDASLALRLRPAYHDLLDPPAGYAPGAEVIVLDLGLRYDPDGGRVRVENAVLLSVASLVPRGAWLRPFSWRFAAGLRRAPAAPLFSDDHGRLGPFVEGGAGVAFGRARGLSAYALATGSADAGSGLDGGYRLGAGAEVGVLAYPAPRWSLRLGGGWREFVAGDDGRERRLAFGSQWQWARDHGLRLTFERTFTEHRSWNRVALTYRHYF